MIVVTEPSSQAKEHPDPGEQFFAAAGSLSGERPTPPSEPHIVASASEPPPHVTEAPPPPETGGFIEKVGDRPAASAVPTPPASYEDYIVHPRPYDAGDYTPPASPYRKKSNLLLWIIIAILAVGIIGTGAALLFVPSVHDAVFGAPTITLANHAAQLQIGDKTDLNELLELERVDANKIGWKSSDPAVATVRDGKVEAVGPGACDITVYSKRDENVCDTIQITVDAPAPEG